MSGRTKIIVNFCLSIFVLLLAGAYAYYSTNQYKSASDWVNNTQEIISEVQTILLDIKDIETAQRGYVITGEAKYLIPYKNGMESLWPSYEKIKNLVGDNKSQLILLDSLDKVINSKIKFAKDVIETRQINGFAEAEKLVTTDLGENLMKKIRILVDTFISNERALLSKRLKGAQGDFSLVKTIIVGSIGLAILIVIITLFFFIKDHNARIKSEKKVIESEFRIKKFLESLPLGIYVLGTDGNPYYANEKSKNILGKGIVPGISVSDLPETYNTFIAGTDELYPSEKLPIVRALNGEANVCAENLEIEKNGKRIPLRINATYIPNSEGMIEYAIAVFEDVTDIRLTEKKLLEAKKQAEESAMLKEAFLANMSHEIRTPMNAIIGFTDLLLKRNLAAQEEDYVRTIKTSGENLLRIINDVLDVSKIESGMMTFETLPLSVKELFASLNSMLSHKALEKNLSLSFTYDPNLPNIVLGDPTRLTQIILNLVGNAIKFTGKGGVDIYAKLLDDHNDIYRVEFSIKDTGIGIPEDKLQNIFERFTQAEAHTTRNYGGTGLGLSIAKQLVELQGGKISVTSTLNHGSVFSFVLPFQKATSAVTVNSPKPSEVDIQKLKEKNILVVEDNPVNVKLVFSLFEEHGIRADLAENGKIALEKFKSKNYDLILMDIEMPEMNGYETTMIIRNVLKSSVPIIAMTANAMAGEREKCIQTGMNAYISKPIREEILLEKMSGLSETETIPVSSSNKNKKFIDLGFLIKSMREKKDKIRDTIAVILKQIPDDLDAINMAVSKMDYLAIKQSAHRMKSTVSLVEISDIEVILEEMEVLAASKTGIERIKELHNSLNSFSEKAIHELNTEKLNYL